MSWKTIFSQPSQAGRKIARRIFSDRRGNVMIIAALSMVPMAGAAGLAMDTVQWSLARRQLQQQADSGATSGAFARAQSADVTQAVQTDITATNKMPLTSTTIENAPAAGAYAGNTNAVRVVLTASKPLPFSSIFLANAPVIRAESTSMVLSMGKFCVLALERSSAAGVTLTGNATLGLGCGMATNSAAANAISAGGSSSANVTVLAAVGSISPSSAYNSNVKIYQHSILQPDPFASLPLPTPSSCSAQIQVNPNQVKSISPGCYSGADIKGTLNLQPGVYYIDGSSGGGFNVGSQANVMGTGVTIILTSTTAASYPASIAVASINGGANLNLTATTSGTYAGILFAQDQRALSGPTNLINGNATSTLQGALYFPNQSVSFTGTSGLQTQCLQLVAKNVSFSGNTSITNNCPAASGAQAFNGVIVRLVG